MSMIRNGGNRSSEKMMLNSKSSDGNALGDASYDNALHGEMVRRKCGRRPIEKARDRFPGAGFEILAMMKICG
jgi:hypothetical protein